MTGNYKIFLLILLGALSAFGPFITDMYLPGLPSMTGFFNTTTSMVQTGLTASMIGMAAGQLIFGAFSDKYGRKRPLIIAMLLFIISTVLCIFSPDIESFIILRFIQGIAGAGGIVMSRCIATDIFTGKELAKTLAIVSAINGIAPISAPVIGGIVMNYVDWRGVFVVLLVLGIILLFGCAKFNESLPPEKRTKEKLLSTFRLFAVVLRNRRYRLCISQQALAMTVLFANIASSPFIIQQIYGYSALFFSIIFAVNAMALLIAAIISMKFKSPEKGILFGSSGMVIFSVAEFIVLYSAAPFWLYEILVFIILFMMGLTIPLSTTLAMDSERNNAGSSSAVLGAVLFMAGGVISPLVGLGNILIPTGFAFIAGSVLSLICAIKINKTIVEYC